MKKLRSFICRPQRRRSQSGYTLLELLVVLVVLGLLAAIATPQLLRLLGGAKSDAAQVQLDALSASLEYYFLDMGAYPTQDQGLTALWQRPGESSGWNGPYVQKQSQLEDPWGRAYIYRFSSDTGNAELVTLGADGKEGGQGENADLSNRPSSE
ncbi:MAG: type II secretion system major pseudopilin GspG [Sphingomonadales bacterium]